VIDRVTHEVSQRSLEPLQNIAVHLGVVADNLEGDLLSKRAGEVTHHAGKPADAIAKGPHPGPQNLKVKTVRKVRGPAIKQVQLLHALGQELLDVTELVKEFVKMSFGPFRKLLVAKGLAEAVEFLRQVRVISFESLHRIRKGPKPA
jgi:hypothetical protein